MVFKNGCPRHSTCLGVVLIGCCLALGQTASAETQPNTSEVGLVADLEKPDGLEWLALPIVKYNSDAGLIYGAQLLMTSYAKAKPWEWRLRIKLRHSTTNRHRHTMLIDVPHSFKRELRCTFRTEFLRISDANYFGIGNDSLNTGDKTVHQFELLEPRGNFMMRYNIYGSLFVGGGLGAWFADIDTREGSLLEQEKPEGWDGGWSTQALLTFGFDNRDHEVVPRQGYFGEFYLKPSVSGDDFYTTFGMTHRAYVSPARWLVVAQRLMVEHHQGDVPLPDLYLIGGSEPQRGIGGVGTQRGFLEGRFIGKTRALSNTEIRGYFPPLWRRLTVGVGPFFDISHVVEEESELNGIHPSGGMEMTFNWKESFVVRIDYAISEEERLLYLQGRHMF